MGIKFKGKTSAGDIADGSIAERELHIDFNKRVLYTSSDGNDVIKLTPDDLIGGGMEWDSEREYEEGTLVIIETSLPGGTPTNQEYISIANNNVGNNPLTSPAQWKLYNVVKWLDQDITLTVGSTGDFATLIDAIEFLSKYSVFTGKEVTLEIQDGHVIDYQIAITVPIPNIVITYAGSDTLSVDISSIASTGGNFIYLVSATGNVTIRDIDFYITGNISASITTHIFELYKIGVSNCTFKCNISTNGGEMLIVKQLEGSMTHCSFVDDSYIVPSGSETNSIYVIENMGYVNDVNIYAPGSSGNGYTLMHCFGNNRLIENIHLHNGNAKGYNNGCIIQGGMTNLRGSDMRQVAGSDNTNDITLRYGGIYNEGINVLGGCNVDPGVMTSHGIRFNA